MRCTRAFVVAWIALAGAALTGCLATGTGNEEIRREVTSDAGRVRVHHDAGPTAPSHDGGVVDDDAGPDDDDIPVGYSIPSREMCGNGIDDDDDGMIDEGCACPRDAVRDCYGGPPETAGRGVCHAGKQTCLGGTGDTAVLEWSTCVGELTPSREVIDTGEDEDCDGTVDEPDGICVPRADTETGEACSNGRDDDCDALPDCADPDCYGALTCPRSCDEFETRCYGGRDDDCDGAIDCDDAQCLGNPACAPSACPRGQTPTYHRRALPSGGGASSIVAGDHGPVMPMTCDDGASCGTGTVRVETSPGSFACVPPPPTCEAGKSATYMGSGTWRCDGPCDLIVHYGTIYGGRTVCAPTPDVTCGGSTVPTFVYESERWECRTACDNSFYDRIYFTGGAFVCVPC